MRCARIRRSRSSDNGGEFVDFSTGGRRRQVFLGAFSALAFMTVLAALGGRILPFILGRQIRLALMVSLLFVFGAKMILEAATYKDDNGDEPGSKKRDYSVQRVETTFLVQFFGRLSSAALTRAWSTLWKSVSMPFVEHRSSRVVHTFPFLRRGDRKFLLGKRCYTWVCIETHGY